MVARSDLLYSTLQHFYLESYGKTLGTFSSNEVKHSVQHKYVSEQSVTRPLRNGFF